MSFTATEKPHAPGPSLDEQPENSDSDGASAASSVSSQSSALVTMTEVLCSIVVAGSFAWFHLPNMFNNSLQTDELLSVWVTSDGLGDTISRAQRFQGQSPVYFVFLWFWRHLAGSSEPMMRLPSLLVVLGACVLAVRFGRELGSRVIGVGAALAIVIGTTVTLAATTARPYSFLLLFALVSTRGLWHWMRDGKLSHGLQWSLGLVLAAAMTPFAVTLAAVHLFALWDYRRTTGSLPRGALRFACLAGILMVPLAPQVLALSNRRDTLVLSADPSLGLITWVLIFPVLLGVAGAILARRSGDGGLRVRLFLAWATLPPILLLIAGFAADSPVFLARYRAVALFGAALLVGIVIHRLPAVAQSLALVAVAAVAVASLEAGQTVHFHGWKHTTEWLNANSSPDEDRILAFNSGLIESAQVDDVLDPAWTPYLTAAIDYYHIDAPTVLLSLYYPEADVIDAWIGELMEHDTILVLDQVKPRPWTPLIREAVTAEGYVEVSGPEAGRNAATIFRRSGG